MELERLLDEPPEVIYNVFVVGGFTITQLHALYGSSKKFKKICDMSDVWDRMYYTKLVKVKGLEKLNLKQFREKVEKELALTQKGAAWEDSQQFSKFPFTRLTAFIYYANVKKLRFAQSPILQIQFDRIILSRKPFKKGFSAVPILNGIEFYDESEDFPDNPPVIEELARKFEWRHDPTNKMNIIETEQKLIGAICYLLDAGWTPSLRVEIGTDEEVLIPPTFTESCIVCDSSPKQLFTCGNRCGKVVYCGKSCAESDWSNHSLNCNPFEPPNGSINYE